MSDSNDPWYRIGYVLESARFRLPQASGDRKAVGDRGASLVDWGDDWVDQLVAASTGALTSKLLDVLPGRKTPGVFRLLRAAVAGAGAAAVLAVFRTRFGNKELEADLGAELLAGAGRGIVYGSILEPHLPGPGVMRGAGFALVEYTLSPWGGLDGVLGAASPRRTLPLLGALTGTDTFEAESFTEHLVFGSTLGLLYGVASSGTASDE